MQDEINFLQMIGATGPIAITINTISDEQEAIYTFEDTRLMLGILHRTYNSQGFEFEFQYRYGNNITSFTVTVDTIHDAISRVNKILAQIFPQSTFILPIED